MAVNFLQTGVTHNRRLGKLRSQQSCRDAGLWWPVSELTERSLGSCWFSDVADRIGELIIKRYLEGGRTGANASF